MERCLDKVLQEKNTFQVILKHTEWRLSFTFVGISISPIAHNSLRALPMTVSVASTEYQESRMMNHWTGGQHGDKAIKQVRP